MKTKGDKTRPIKMSVFLTPKVHRRAIEEADREKLSLSKWVAQLVADQLGVTVDSRNGATYY